MAIYDVEYKTSVLVNAGWRSVWIKATAEKISEKRVKIDLVTEIDGEIVHARMSRTGSKRQSFNGNLIAEIELGKVKNISSLHSILERV